MRTFAVYGDSQAATLAPHLNRALVPHGYALAGVRAHVGYATKTMADSNEAVDLARERPDLVIVALGGNDTASLALPAQIHRVVEQLRSSGPVRIVWIGPAHSTRMDVQARHRATSELQSHIVPGLGVEWYSGQDMTRDLAHTPDEVHFPAASAIQWAERIGNAISRPSWTEIAVGIAAFAAVGLTATGLGWWWRRR